MTHVVSGLVTAFLAGVAILYADVWILGALFGVELPYLVIVFSAICLMAFIGLFVAGQKAQSLESIVGLLIGMYGGDLMRISMMNAESRVF